VAESEPDQRGKGGNMSLHLDLSINFNLESKFSINQLLNWSPTLTMFWIPNWILNPNRNINQIINLSYHWNKTFNLNLGWLLNLQDNQFLNWIQNHNLNHLQFNLLRDLNPTLNQYLNFMPYWISNFISTFDLDLQIELQIISDPEPEPEPEEILPVNYP